MADTVTQDKLEKSGTFHDPSHRDELAEDTAVGQIINASGHPQEVDRHLNFLSLCGIAIAADNAWAAGGGALVVAMYNGGPPGVLWEFILVSLFYGCIGASLAELASSIPSAANVYHWASVTGGPKYGRFLSYYAGYYNWWAWNFGAAFSSLTIANSTLAIYNLYHPDYVFERWHAFIGYVAITWIDCVLIMYGQRVLRHVGSITGIGCLLLAIASILVCAIVPAAEGRSASSHFVWAEWQNLTGYSSNGFVFLAGTLNGAFAIGTPDGVCHLAEEIPDPRRNIPKGIAAQLIAGFTTTFAFYIALMYAITSLEDIFESQITELPLATVYLQATGSTAGTTALLVILMVDLTISLPNIYVTAGRMLWTLGRDGATPFSRWVGRISPTFHNQLNATFACGVFSTVFGCVYLGSPVAFAAFVDCFTILTTFSYLLAILPHLLSKRKYIKPGPFWMPARWAYLVGGLACAYIILCNGVIYFFPFSLPVTAQTMNYSVVIVGGGSLLILPWYFWRVAHGYTGPAVVQGADDNAMRVRVGAKTKSGVKIDTKLV